MPRPRIAQLPTSIRVPIEVLQRLDVIAGRMAQVPEFVAMTGTPTRSVALRLALVEGVRVLEERWPATAPPPPHTRRRATKQTARPVAPAVVADTPVESPRVTAVEPVAAAPNPTAPSGERLIYQTRDVNGVELSLSDGSGLARLLPQRGWINLRYKTSPRDRVTDLSSAQLSDLISRVLRRNARDAPPEQIAAQLDARLQEAARLRRK